MQALLALLGSIATGEAADAVGRAKRAAIAYAICGLLLAIGLFFLLIAAFLALAYEIGALKAALWFGGGFVVVAILILVIFRIVTRMRARRIAERRQTELRSVVSTAAIALVPAMLASRTGSIALLAPIAATLGYGVWKENARRKRRPPSRPQ